MRISQLAEHTGVPASTLRFYETAGLLPAERTPAGYRRYGQDSVRRLEFIGAAQHLGLPLAEIADLLVRWESGSCTQVKDELRPRVADRIAEAGHRAAELDRFTAVLRQALAHLTELPDRSGRCDPRCTFLSSPTTERWRAAPVACSLTGDGVAERAEQWRHLLSGAVAETIVDGVRLEVRAPAEAAELLAGLFTPAA
ncbi:MULTISPECIES: MerR family transcriptional regulator [unclassified Crossiella]|uniref:MerR family transcriptional regulator n=1 Tax=unclassified Crossiella TaxID=2620835 RepID=UPI001FFF5379|nr:MULTISPECIES: MerR family transcriptional regulator [unclassified Crossiella]MCK2244411.1 MerR family transcriptional regulator [Crossiella sp. S99.2]MCK2257761.1 MerR family transcriptional regulator [Crossiella sp. S99.1]